ncbi:uncharacterized protein TNCV_3748921 [Trichonephila clavipes]|nr:uncharacterized protein TNCV_3748921 [Trichonephila clavipes]
METGFSKFFRSSLRDAEIILRAGQRIISEINILVENSQGSSQIPKSNPQLLNAEIKKKIARHENIKKTLAICQALDDLVESHVHLLVLSDSLSVLSALQNFSRGCGSPVVKVSNHGRHVMSSIPVPLKTRRVGQRCTLNLSRAETSSRWCGVGVRRGCQLRCRPRHLTMVPNYVVRRQRPSCS